MSGVLQVCVNVYDFASLDIHFVTSLAMTLLDIVHFFSVLADDLFMHLLQLFLTERLLIGSRCVVDELNEHEQAE